MTETIWVMDSDLCDACDGFVDGFGVCTDCGYDGISEEEWSEWEQEDNDYED